MQDVNRMGLRVAGITALLLLVLFGLYWGTKRLLNLSSDLEDRPPGSLTSEERERDTDGDGVADQYEINFYQTDPNLSDTDGDGASDLDEILAGQDPLVAGGAPLKPATGSKVTVQETFTQKYLATLPDDVARETILNQVQLEAYVQANRGELIYSVAESEVTIAPGSGESVVVTYLDIISAAHNTELTAITSADIEAGFRLHVNSRQTEPLIDITIALANNVGILEAVAVPEEAAALHTKLIGASKSLSDNARLLADVDNDFVGALIGAKNIEDLGGVFQEIAQEVLALEEKYGLE